MLARTAMSVFSDAHELVEIPLIAANLRRLILPRQSQVWAVLRKADSDQRLAYSLAATFLGQMCLSGEIANLSATQWLVVERATKLYRQVASIIKQGTSRRWGELGASWRHPQGWQAVVRSSTDNQQMLVVLHTFAQAPKQVDIPLSKGRWKIAGQFSAGASLEVSSNGKLHVSTGGDFSGAIFVLVNG
jgi:alpha-galactosidase